MSRRSWRKSGDHQGEQACHRRTPDREPQPGHPRLGELSSSRGKQADLLTSGPRDLSCVMAVGQTEAPQEVQTMDQRPILRDHRPTALGLTRHSRRLGGGHPTGLAPRRLKCADPATYQGQRGSESLRPRLGTVLRGTSRREDGRDPGGPMDSAAALEGARRYLSGLQPEDHHGDGVAQPPYRVANPWGQGYDREPRAGASELPSTDPQPRVRCGKAASCKGRSRGLSCMKGNFHVQFLGEGVAATSPPYPTLGWATTQVYPARCPAMPCDALDPDALVTPMPWTPMPCDALTPMPSDPEGIGDFNSGTVHTAPMNVLKATKKPWSLANKITLFESRVEVWQLGVAAAMLIRSSLTSILRFGHTRHASLWRLRSPTSRCSARASTLTPKKPTQQGQISTMVSAMFIPSSNPRAGITHPMRI